MAPWLPAKPAKKATTKNLTINKALVCSTRSAPLVMGVPKGSHVLSFPPWFIEQWGKASAHCRASPCGQGGSCHAGGPHAAHQPRSPSSCPLWAFLHHHSCLTSKPRTAENHHLPQAFPLHAEHSSLSGTSMQRVWSATWRHREDHPSNAQQNPKHTQRSTESEVLTHGRKEARQQTPSAWTSIASVWLQRGTGADGISCQTPKGFDSVNKFMRTWLP